MVFTMVFTKTISINAAADLEGPKSQSKVTLLLVFNNDAVHSEGAVPTVWKLIPFLLRQDETQGANPVYQATLGISKAEVNFKQAIEPGLARRIDIGQQTNLELKDGMPTFTKPTNDFMQERFAINNKLTTLPTISAGLYDAQGNLNIISTWKEVLHNSTVDIGFTPILSIYATFHYIESQLSPVHLGSPLWSHDLNDETLPDTVKLNLIWDGKNNNYILEPSDY